MTACFKQLTSAVCLCVCLAYVHNAADVISNHQIRVMRTMLITLTTCAAAMVCVYFLPAMAPLDARAPNCLGDERRAAIHATTSVHAKEEGERIGVENHEYALPVSCCASDKSLARMQEGGL